MPITGGGGGGLYSPYIPWATTEIRGIVELATTTEANAGIDTVRAVVPSGLLVRKVGTAIIGGDLTGNVRGYEALDVQVARTLDTEVASGYQAVTFGYRNTASERRGTAIGCLNTASELDSTAVGYSNIASGSGSSALGYLAVARIEKTTNICGPQINRKDNGETPSMAPYYYCGVEVVLMSKEVDLEVIADQTLTLPIGCKFWLNEVGCICTSLTGLTTQPIIRFGITGDLDKHSTAAITSHLTGGGKREVRTSLVPEDGEISLTAGVTVAAVATTMLGRFYWKGMLVEDE